MCTAYWSQRREVRWCLLCEPTMCMAYMVSAEADANTNFCPAAGGAFFKSTNSPLKYPRERRHSCSYNCGCHSHSLQPSCLDLAHQHPPQATTTTSLICCACLQSSLSSWRWLVLLRRLAIRQGSCLGLMAKVRAWPACSMTLPAHCKGVS
jgi:hypothetical protein